MSVEKVFFHLDLDAFFASVEEIDHPEYRGKPLVVGALPGERGVVSTCNYKAREFGVRSAMPISQAARLCPHAVFVRPRLDRYQQISEIIMNLLENFTPSVQRISIDEASLDMTGMERLLGLPVEAARTIKEAIKTKVGLTASIGIGPLPYLAKMASEENKPDGLFEIKSSEVKIWLATMDPIRLPGVGKKTRQRLGELGINTVGQIQDLPLPKLQSFLGQAQGAHLFYLANGMEPPGQRLEHKTHSISSETTFQEDTTAILTLEQTIVELAHQVFFRALEERSVARTLILKLRLHDFSLNTFQKTLNHFISSAKQLSDLAIELFKTRWNGQPVRLLGLGLSNFSRMDEEPEELFEDEAFKRRKLEIAVLKIQSKYREGTLTKACFLEKSKHPFPKE